MKKDLQSSFLVLKLLSIFAIISIASFLFLFFNSAQSATSTNSPTNNTGTAWTNPTNAYADGTSYANITSGNPSGSNVWGNYGFNLTGSTISQVKVRADAWSLGIAGSPTSQTARPTGDDTDTATSTKSTGTTFWGVADETILDDSDYYTMANNSGGHVTMTFPAFTVPANSAITNITVYYRANNGGAANIRSTIKVGTTYYDNVDAGNDPSAYTTYSYAYTVNPATGAAWTYDEINGTDANTAHRLNAFGTSSTDCNPDNTVSWVYAVVNYTPAAEYDDQIKVDVSWDGGTSWSTPQSTTLTGTETTTWFDFTGATAWTPEKLANGQLQVRTLAQTVNTAEVINLDWLPVEVTTNIVPSLPTLVSPADGSITTDNTPTLSANYSDPDTGDVGTTDYRVSSTNALDCLNNLNIAASGTSAATITNNENTTWTPGAIVGANGTYYWCAQNNDGTVASNWTSMGNFILDTSTPDVVTVDAGASLADRTSLTSDTWFKYSDTGSDDQVSFSWTDPSSISDDTFYYELNATSTGTIDGTELNTTNPYVDSITLSEGTNYFHVKPRNGAGTWGIERIFTIKYDKSAPTNISISGITADSATQLTVAGNIATDSGAGLSASPYWFNETSGNSGGSDSIDWQLGTTWINSGLSANTQYTYQIKAQDALNNESSYSPTLSKYTLANVPGAPTISNIAYTALDISFNANSNPANTQFAIYETSTGKYVDSTDGSLDLISENWQTYANWGGASGKTVVGLSEGTNYIFQVKARNGDLTETAFGSTGSGLTLTSDLAPNAPTLISPANTSLTTDTTPTLSAHYSDNDAGDVGTTNYRIASTNATDCLNNLNISAFGTSAATSTNNENTSWTPASTIGTDGTYYWCAQNNDGVMTSSWTSMGNFILDASGPTGGSILYTNGYHTSTSINLTANDGTDSVSGLNVTTRLVQRKSALLSSGTCQTYGSFATITPTGTYPNYTDSTIASGNCYQYQYLIADNLGNQGTYTSSNVVKVDTGAPAGGSLTYADGYASGSISLTAVDGTESISGINTSSRIIQRKSASLIGGVCQAYGSFATITPTGTYPNYTDSTIASGNCYQYQYLVSDNAGNQSAPYTSINTVKMDTDGPTGAGISNVAINSTTQLMVTANIPSDASSGLDATPYWFEETTNNAGGSDSTSWQASNVFVDSGLTANTQYTYRVKARDTRNNESVFSATFLPKYTLASQVTSVSLADASTNNTYKINLSWLNQGQSGVKIEQDTNCDGFETTVYDNTSSTPVAPYSIDAAANTCYEFRISSYNGDGVLNIQNAIPQSNQLTTPPAQPTGLTHIANTISSINWDWNDVSGATGYKVYRVSDNQLLQTISTATSTWNQDSLLSDTQYSVYVRATNANGEGISSLSSYAYTSANMPSSPSHSVNTPSSITWNWTSGGNQKDFYAWCANPADNSNWIAGTSWLQSSLSANSLYQFFVKARNEENDETGAATASQFTSQNTPAGISFDTVSANSIALSAQGILPNLSSNSSGLYFTNNTLTQNSGWMQTNSWNNSSLTPNTQYAYQIKARNGDADESGYTAEQTKYTLANAPSAPNLSEANFNTIKLTLNTNSNPAATEYAIYETSTGKYVDSTDGSLDLGAEDWKSVATWGGASGFTVTSLSPNLIYTFKVKARNSENVATALSASASIATLSMPVPPNAPVLVSPANGSYTNDTTPTLIARYSDNNIGDTGLTNYRLSSTSFADCINNLNIIASATTNQTLTNDENTFWTINSPLTSNQAYYWCAQNNDGTDVSSWTNMGSFILDTTSPTGSIISLSSITATSVTAQVSGATDSDSGLNASPYYFLNNTDFSVSDWQASDLWINNSLTPNTTYSFQIKTRDALGNESSYSAAQSALTLANIPTSLTLTSNSTSQITANWSSNGNSQGTEYYIENITEGTSSGWITTTSWVSDALDENTQYTFRIKARNNDGDDTSWTMEVSGKTLSIVLISVIASSDNDDDEDKDNHDNENDDNKSDDINTAINRTVSSLPHYISILPEIINEQLGDGNSLIPKEAPLAFKGGWNLISAKPLGEFLSAYPEKFNGVIGKFSDFSKLNPSLGISNFSDFSQLSSSLRIAELANPSNLGNVPFTLPGLNDLAWNANDSSVHPSIPVSMFPSELKKRLPDELIFAQTSDGNIDMPINISLDEQGNSVQKITTISGKMVRLALKPVGDVKDIKGYLLFNSASTNPDKEAISMNQSYTQKLTDSLEKLFLPLPLLAKEKEATDIEARLLTSQFEFTDPDGDGIFEAEIKSPISEGEYEIITMINYKNPSLGQKELRLTTVVDPEGYVYRKIKEDELRVKNAKVSIYYSKGKDYGFELWPGSDYRQKNPQITDNTGKYSFLVPPGKYYLKVESQGYKEYIGDEFIVTEGEGIHQNIELQKKLALSDIDWKAFVLFPIMMLGMNFWRNRKAKRSINQIK